MITKNYTLKMNKNKIIFLTILTLLFLLTGCSNEDIDNSREFLYSYEIKTFVEKKSNTSKKFYSKKSSDFDVINTKILSTEPLDANMSEDELSQYLIELKPNIKIETSLNDNKIIQIDVIDGVSAKAAGPKYPNSDICPECEHDSDGNIKDRTDCSQQGVKHCAYSTFQTWSTPKIIAVSIAGGTLAVVNACITRNCFGW